MFIISSGYRRFWCIFITNKHLPLSQCIPDNAALCLCMGVRERKWWETNYLNLKWINPFCLSELGEWGNTERQLNTWKIFIKSQKIKVGGLSTLVKNTDGTTFVLRCARSLLQLVEQWGGAFYIIFCFLVFNTEVCLHMWMYKDVYSSHTCVEMNQRALHAELQSPSGHTSGASWRYSPLGAHFETSWKNLLFGSRACAILRTLNSDTRSGEHFVSSPRASSAKPKDRTPLGHTKPDMGNPRVRGEARRGRWGCWGCSALALTSCWPWVNLFIFFSKQAKRRHLPTEEGMITR